MNSPNGITTVDTGFMAPGFDASYLIVEQGRAAFVDTGPGQSTPNLLAALEAADVAPEQVDYLLPTHVHLDHAGGVGALLKHLPNATIIAHPRAAPHLIKPGKLIAGSIAVYGERQFYEMYGEIVPVPAGRVHTVDDGEGLELAGRRFEFLHTEGHARHHYCVHDGASGSIFSGDSFGVSYRLFDNERGEFIFPTTTPVQFDPDAAHASVDRLLALEPQRIFVTHFGAVTHLPRLAADMHELLDAYVAIALRYADHDEPTAMMKVAMFELLSGRLQDHGWDGDSAAHHQMLDMDVELNVQGLEVWLERRAR